MPDLPFDPIAEARRQWAERWGEAPGPSMSAVTSIMRVQQILLARLNEVLKPFGLTFPRYEALMLLYFSRRGVAAAGEDGRAAAGPPHERDQHRRQLERSGFVRREPHPTDRRTTLAALTDAGPRDGRRRRPRR